MKVLLIGGTGLISTAITRTLVERGDDVTHFNRGQNSAPANVQTIQGDRTKHATFEQQMQQAGTFDCVIDMVGYTPQDARSAVRAFAGRTGHYVFCSTVDVYDKDEATYPQRESAPRAGRNNYGRDKVLCEEILEAAQEGGAFPLTILRPAQTYRDGSLIIFAFGGGHAWVDRLRKQQPIIVHGDGTSLWCAAHADDVGPAFARAAGNPTAFDKAYNVTGEEVLTWNDMYRKAARVLGAPEPQLVHIPTDFLIQAAPGQAAIVAENFSHPNIFDNSAAQRDLDFGYTVSFAEGVRRGLQWQQADGKIETAESADPTHDQIIRMWQRLTAQVNQYEA
jgi:nucleoside-diphosphate-sugar epimerase